MHKQYSPDYTLEYFDNLKSSDLNYKVLKTCIIENKVSGRKTAVIPIVNFVSSANSAKNLLVVNMAAQGISEILERNIFTENSGIVMLEADGTIAAFSQMHRYFNEEEFVQILANWPEEDTRKLQTQMNGEKVLIIREVDANNLINTSYQFVAIIPFSDVYKESESLRFFTAAMAGLSIFVGLWLSLRLQGSLYKPIRELLTMLEQDAPRMQSGDEFVQIKSLINQILLEKSNLSDDMKKVLPLVQEQYILGMLHANESIFSDNHDTLLKKYKPQYRYPFYYVAVTTFRFTQAFQDEYSLEEERTILNHLPAITSAVIPSEYEYYILGIEQYTLCTVINVDKPSAIKRIDEQFTLLADMFAYDKALVKIQTGIGSVCDDIEKISVSYRDALSAFSTLSPKEANSTALFHGDNGKAYRYSIQDSNRIVNYLLLGDKENAIALLDEILGNNRTQALPDNKFKEVLIQVFNTALLSLHGQRVSLGQLMGDQYIDLFQEMHEMGTDRIVEYLYLLFNAIADYSRSKMQKPEMETIKQYIDAHYREDIYLQAISEKFQIQPKYLSRLLKDYLSMTFMEYVSSLRLEQAKKQLIETNDTLDRIAQNVGYNSRNTFIRMFKKVEGITPTNYRVMHTKKRD